MDQGPGIPPELREQVFERFWRAREPATGAGLGLAIMRAYGGTVRIVDNSGDAVFILEF